MAVQLDYGFTIDKGVAGGKCDLSFDTCVSRCAEGTGVKCGLAVVTGTKGGVEVKVPTASTQKFEGIVVNGGANVEMDANGVATIADGRCISVMTHGKIWARLATDDDEYVTVAYGDAVYVVASGAEAGCVTNSSTGTIATGAKFIGVGDNGIAPIAIA